VEDKLTQYANTLSNLPIAFPNTLQPLPEERRVVPPNIIDVEHKLGTHTKTIIEEYKTHNNIYFKDHLLRKSRFYQDFTISKIEKEWCIAISDLVVSLSRFNLFLNIQKLG
jgi:hypothetical protein